MTETIRIATRTSRLALWQADHVADLLRESDPSCRVALVHVSTVGDRDRTEPLAQLGGQGVFTREVQSAVLDGRADLAVHSLKDLPTIATTGLVLAGIPSRAGRFDALVLPNRQTCESLDVLPAGARIGTGSLRRQAQLLRERADLRVMNIRGNVETRLAKVDAGEYDAIILAEAGLNRLGLSERVSLVLRPPLMFPAVGQAALGIECREEDESIRDRLTAITNAGTQAEVLAERACLRTLRAGCHAPVGTFTQLERLESDSTDIGELSLEAVVLSGDGQTLVSMQHSGTVEDSDSLGIAVAEGLLEQGAQALLDAES